MTGRLIALVVLCLFSAATKAMTNQEILTNLRSRILDLKDDGALIRSFTGGAQTYIYDQALAIIAFTRAGDRSSAKRLLRGLSSLQKEDGSLYFSYALDGSSPYPAETDRRYAGAIAWVAISAVQYQATFGQEEFRSFNLKILNWLSAEMKANGVLRFNPTDISATAWRENETAALEHNVDAFSAFSQFARLNPAHDWKNEIASLRSFILSLWDKDRGHFWSGKNLSTGKMNKEELYLDNQTWTLLALDETALNEVRAHDALALNCESLAVEHVGVSGFVDRKPTIGQKKFSFVWSEGTLGQVLAMKKFATSCGNRSSGDYLQSVKTMKAADGGVAYATSGANPDFTTASSVAGTAWMFFAMNEINPFTVIPVRAVALQKPRTANHDL